MDIVELVKGTASDELLDRYKLMNEMRRSPYNIAELLDAGIGMSGEVGEFNELIKKHLFHDKPIDLTHAKKELGDIYWYFALACIGLETTPYEIQEIVSDKLNARYQGGRFNKELSENRKAEDC